MIWSQDKISRTNDFYELWLAGAGDKARLFGHMLIHPVKFSHKYTQTELPGQTSGSIILYTVQTVKV